MKEKEIYIRIGTFLYTFYHIGTDGELLPMKRKGRYFEINRGDIDEILL